MSDPTLAKVRKDKVIHKESGRNTYRLEIKFKLPAGFARFQKSLGASVSTVIYAQDSRNRWFRLTLSHMSMRALGEQNKKPEDKKVTFETWKSNWESEARGSMADKTKKFQMAGIRGEGYKNLRGEIDGWPATFNSVLGDAKGWRNFCRVETRGGFAKEYAKPIKALLKSFKLKPVK